MRVLHVISSGGMYGAEAVILTLAQAMRERSHSTSLGVFLNSAQPNDQLYSRAMAEGVDAHRIHCRGQLDLSVRAAIRQLASRSIVDVVHAHGYKADLYTYAALRNTGTPLVSTCHTWYDNDARVRFYGTLDRWVLKRFAGVVAVSEGVRQRLLGAGVSSQRIYSIRNGIDYRPFTQKDGSLAKENAALMVGLVGRLAQEKGIDLFLSAAALVLGEFPLTRFSIVGDGPDRAKLEASVTELGIAANVTLLGRVENMPAFYTTLDLLVSASRQEGLPIALLEGMASGLPLIATSVGEVSSVVRNGVTGLLVPPNDVNALAQAMLVLLRDRRQRKLYGAAARNLVTEEFSAQRMATEYLRLYEKVIVEVKR